MLRAPRRSAARSVFALCALVGAGCSSESEPAGDGAPQFRKDVLPLLETWCATSDCHGGSAAKNAGLLLPTNDPAAVYSELTTRESTIARGTKLIVPGDPEKSFLQAKIDGRQTSFGAPCVPSGCGETMPPGSRLNTEPRDRVRAWIAAGAKDD
jgi:hypothetical protein